MLTLFSCPMLFQGHFGIILRNAIRSCTLIDPRPDIIIFNDGEMTAEICKELKLSHNPHVTVTWEPDSNRESRQLKIKAPEHCACCQPPRGDTDYEVIRYDWHRRRLSCKRCHPMRRDFYSDLRSRYDGHQCVLGGHGLSSNDIEHSLFQGKR